MVKEVQRLTGRIAALNRFVSRSVERCLQFFQTLKKLKDFQWTNECRNVFEELKAYLSAPPLLSKPKVGEELYLYLAVSPVYWFHSSWGGRPSLETSFLYQSSTTKCRNQVYSAWNMIFVLITSAKKLRPYFQAHTVVVLMNQPLKMALHKPNMTGKVAKWALKLAEFDLVFWSQPSIKTSAGWLCDWVHYPGRRARGRQLSRGSVMWIARQMPMDRGQN